MNGLTKLSFLILFLVIVLLTASHAGIDLTQYIWK